MDEADIYAEQLSCLRRGYALFEPDSEGCGFDKVRVGDVGYIRDGAFCKLFNICADEDDPANAEGVPADFQPLPERFRGVQRRTRLPAGLMNSSSLQKLEGNISYSSSTRLDEVLQAGAWIKVKCTKKRGAALLIKDNAFRSDALSRSAFAESIIRNHLLWLAHANDELGRGIALRELVLVTGCDLTREWTIATFDEATHNVDVNFNVQTPVGSTGSGFWGEWQSTVHVPNRSGPGPLLPPSSPGPTTVPSAPRDRRTTDFNQCIFIRGYRIFRRFIPIPIKLRAAAGPENLPGDFNSPFGSAVPAVYDNSSSAYVEFLEALPREPSEHVADIYEISARRIFEINRSIDFVLLHDDDVIVLSENIEGGLTDLGLSLDILEVDVLNGELAKVGLLRHESRQQQEENEQQARQAEERRPEEESRKLTEEIRIQAPSRLETLLLDIKELDMTDKVQGKLIRKLGGGYTDVLVWEFADGSCIAEKRIQSYTKDDLHEVSKRVARELRIWFGLRHPNVLPLKGYIKRPDDVFPSVVTDWMEHGSLTQFLKANTNIDEIGMIKGITDGLSYLHSEGIVHGDLKAENVVISQDRIPMLMNFGISHLPSGTSGSVRWLAPELLFPEGQEGGGGVHTKNSDIWALGMTWLEVLTKKVPYAYVKRGRQVVKGLRWKVLPRTPDDWKSWTESKRQIWELCKCCWCIDVAQRPSAKTLAREVDVISAQREQTQHRLEARKKQEPEPSGLWRKHEADIKAQAPAKELDLAEASFQAEQVRRNMPNMPGAQMPAQRTPQKSWTCETTPFPTPPAFPFHASSADGFVSYEQPGWTMPPRQSPRTHFTMDFPVPLNGTAVDMTRRESAPAPRHAHITPLQSTMTYSQLQRTHHHMMVFPQAKPYPDANYGYSGYEALDADFASVANRANFSSELATFSPKSTTSYLPPLSPGHLKSVKAADVPVRSETLLAAVHDIETIEKLFVGWHHQLSVENTQHHAHHARKKGLEQEFLKRLEDLKALADSLLAKSESMLKTYHTFVAAVEDDLSHIEQSRSGAYFRSGNELTQLGESLTKDSEIVTECVEKMRDQLHDLVKSLREAKDLADEKASRDRILHTFIRSFKIFNVGIGVSAALSQVAPQPAGIIATVGLGSTSVLVAATAELADNFRKNHFGETEFEATLKYIDKDVPDALRKAQLSLSSLRGCHQQLKLDLTIREPLWMRPQDASAARKVWQNARDRLRIENAPSVLSLTKSLRVATV